MDGDLSLGEYGTGVEGEATFNSFSAVVSLPSVPCGVTTVSVEPAETGRTTPSLSAPDDDERERRRYGLGGGLGSCCVGDDTSVASASGANGFANGVVGESSIPKSSRLSARGGGRSTSASRS